MVPLVIFYHWYHWLPSVAIGTIGSLKTPNEYQLPLVFLLVVNNESRSSFSTTPLQEQIDTGVAKTNSFAI